MRPREAIGDVDRRGIDLVTRLVASMNEVRAGFRDHDALGVAVAAHQLVWHRFMVTGDPAFGDAVITSLGAICQAEVDESLGGQAQLLELLTWVWRQCRRPDLRGGAEGIATRVVERMRVPGRGFAAGPRGEARADEVSAAANGLMLVALIEAGSVFERRDWLALSREVFEEIVTWHLGARGGEAEHLDDLAMMSRAAIRFFEAFGKPRYLELAQAWVATLDEAFLDAAHGGYGDCVSCVAPSIADHHLPSSNALMIGVHARLHALTGGAHHAERAARLAEAFYGAIPLAGIAAATAIAGIETMTRFVTIKVSGDPTLTETRELMRIALDYGLPDRLVLGPGAGDPADASPRARISIATHRLAPITEAVQLRALTAPGGLISASRSNATSQSC